MNSKIIKLNWPNPKLMPNRKNGKAWMSIVREKQEAVHEGYFKAIGGDFKPADTVALRITFCAPDKRHRDLDNLLASIKPHLDGVARGLGVNDKQFRPIIINSAIDSKKKGFVTLELSTQEKLNENIR